VLLFILLIIPLILKPLNFFYEIKTPRNLSDKFYILKKSIWFYKKLHNPSNTPETSQQSENIPKNIWNISRIIPKISSKSTKFPSQINPYNLKKSPWNIPNQQNLLNPNSELMQFMLLKGTLTISWKASSLHKSLRNIFWSAIFNYNNSAGYNWILNLIFTT
jgi:hypothetical protein